MKSRKQTKPTPAKARAIEQEHEPRAERAEQAPPEAALPSDPILTINHFADTTGCDRRTTRRRVQAANIKPVRVEGRASLYFLSDLESAMSLGAKPAHNLRESGLNPLGWTHETTAKHVCESLTAILPGVVRDFTKGKLTDKEANRLAVRLWYAIADTLADYFRQGRFNRFLRSQGAPDVNEGWLALGFSDKWSPPSEVSVPVPESIRTAARALQISIGDTQIFRVAE